MNQLATDGPMGVTVEDVGALLSIQSGYDRRAPLSLGADEALGHVEAMPLEGLRVGWIGDWNGHLPLEDGVLALCEQALRRFEAAGAIVEPVVPSFDPERLWHAWLALRNFMVGCKLRPYYDDPVRRDLLKPEARWEVENGLNQTALDVYRASMERTAWTRAVEPLFDTYDILVLPSAQLFPFPAEWTWPKEIAGRTMDTYHRWMEVVIGPTMAGAPVMCVPAGRDAANRNIGLQLWGPARADNRVLAIAAAYERIAPELCHARPPAFAGRS
jgi:amidase